MGQEEKKTHSKFLCDQTNVSWSKTGGTNFGSPVNVGGDEFLENCKKHQWGRTRRRRIASFIVIR